MPFMVVADDAAGVGELRARLRPAHLDYLEANLDRLIGAGARLSDDGLTPLGSLYLLATDDRAEAEAFVANDPYAKAGVFGRIEATRWRRGVLDHKSFLSRG
jgi:uncharacterized protein YciI